ncbi:hypothetical protein WCE04_28110, partial [Pseudomonas shirazica]
CFVAYLAGPAAGYVTGASLRVDGGFAASLPGCLFRPLRG